jgi:hypothetical protein
MEVNAQTPFTTQSCGLQILRNANDRLCLDEATRSQLNFARRGKARAFCAIAEWTRKALANSSNFSPFFAMGRIHNSPSQKRPALVSKGQQFAIGQSVARVDSDIEAAEASRWKNEPELGLWFAYHGQ